MKYILITLAFTLNLIAVSFAQTGNKAGVSFDGIYIVKSGEVPAAKIEIYTYLRFYKDGTVCLQAVSSYDPKSVAAWFGRYKKYSQKGTFQVSGTNITIELDNKESEDIKLEGLQQTKYKGVISHGNKLCLKRDAETQEKCFEFYQTADTTVQKYSTYKPVIKLPGEWKLTQILKGSKQVFFTNNDSTVIAVSVVKKENLPVYKQTQSSFETAYAYFEWDSKYMQDEEKMQVKKIAESKDKSFVTWNAKDKNNDNYYLFAVSGDLVYNIMIYDTKMPVDQQLKIIEDLYDLNKQ